MKTINDSLVEWVISKIEQEYTDDVSLLIGNDFLKLEQDSKGCSFSYFVPANDKANNLAKTFIIDGIGYDLYPRTWDRLECMANLDDYNPTYLANAQILYYRNEADKKRFLDIQEKLKENLKNTELLFTKALEKLNVAMGLYQTMMFEEKIGKVRMAAGFIADYLSVAVASVNHTYFKYSQINQMDELSVMQDLPDNFIQYYKSIINASTVSELQNLCHLMILSTRKFLSARKTKKAKINVGVDFHNLADWYQELCYTWRRIYYWCDQKNEQKVFVWACMLQQELMVVSEEFGLEEMDLLGSYCAADLSSLRKQAESIEKLIVSVLEENGVELDSYSSVEDFLAENS